MPAIFDFHHTVRSSEIDELGHVNNLEYVRWLLKAAVAHSAAQGWPPEAYHAIGQGWVARSHFIEYLIPAFEGDEVIVRTWVADMKRVTSLRRYQILRPADNKQLVAAETNWAYVTFGNLRPARVPAEIQSSFELVANRELTSSEPPGAPSLLES